MPPLFKYLATVAVVISGVMTVGTLTMSEIAVGLSAVAGAPSTDAARWSAERLRAKVDVEYVGRGSLSPIYPTTAGKELMEKPVYAAAPKRVIVPQAQQLNKLPLQLFPEFAQNNNFPRQSLSYAETRATSPLRARVISGHELY
ncbi:MAG TPA: hypothetical protein VGF53_14870 [Pseudolabrys sp.]|jgi:hypothetical protein